jgi:hypothetical protein
MRDSTITSNIIKITQKHKRNQLRAHTLFEDCTSDVAVVQVVSSEHKTAHYEYWSLCD